MARKMASKEERLQRVKKGVAAAPKRFKGTRAASQASRPAGVSSSAKTFKDRRSQEAQLGLNRGRPQDRIKQK